MHDDWAICACIRYASGELLDKNKPFATYHVEAKTASAAVKKLKKDFSCCEVDVCGQPIHSTVSDTEYNT